MDEIPRTATRLRAAVARIDRLLARDVVGSGLTRTDFSVLGALSRADSLRLADLVDRERVHPTMLSRVVGRLVGAGWVTRLPDPDDGRAALLSITDAGTVLYRRLQRERAARIETYLDGLDDEQAGRLAAALPVLEGLADHLTTGGEPPLQAARARAEVGR
ncbi:MarR family transcriptional regulator [Modestobacter sp. I12A-02628]|uniref:MarR family transcriptional regulator n=1 Tax=Goekera deserti TaxID=2497753 RepID=A0A7K3WK54_9ACTN|nr:MarR family transcriptional regulator [Goekera deserti]MPQ96427.1 MarR family transcriptional regulator [Goekera deserti]NDI47260.1 MarR family transcriptional regulator [Goekera deserti]NEL56090.1 MarR family transcriptional regulator [Goekera deserti]